MDLHDAILEKQNNLMKGKMFIEGPTAEKLWQNLCCQIAMLRYGHPPDSFVLPDMNEAGAWNKAWEIYQVLKRRREQPAAPEQIARYIAQRSSDEAWNRYVHNREEIISYKQHYGLTGDIASYIGLEPGDLDDPVSRDPNLKFDGRLPDWPSRAGRIASALQAWKDLTPEAKRAVPIIMASRRAEAALRKMETRFVAIEARLAALEGTARNESAA
jgi:hypothetical protein